MLETIFIILLVIAILMLVLTVVWDSLSLGALDIILWVILAGTVHSIEIPYVAIQNDNTIVEGVHVIENLHPLSMLFIAIAFIVFLYWTTTIIWPMYQQKYSKIM